MYTTTGDLILPTTVTGSWPRPRWFDKSLWGVAVVDHKGKLVYGRNEHRLFTPASNTKLVVTAVASALLPQRQARDFWKTAAPRGACWNSNSPSDPINVRS